MEKVRERGSVGLQPFAAWDGAATPWPSPAAAASPGCPRRSANARLIYSSEPGAHVPSVHKRDWSPGGF